MIIKWSTMDLSEIFMDIWSAYWLDYGDSSESIDARNDKLTASTQHHLPQSSSISSQPSKEMFSNSTENNSTDILIPNTVTDSNHKVREIKEFSDAIDAYFSSGYSSIEIDEAEPLASNHSIPFSSSSLICYNSTCSSQSLSTINAIDHQNHSPDCQNVVVKPLGCSKLSLAKDCSKVKEPWVPNVAKKVLTSYYSPLSMKSELLSNEIMLDAYESVVLQEAAQAFNNIAFTKPHCDIDLALAVQYDFYSDPRPVELVYSCEKIRAYRKINTEDKIKLMAHAFFEINAVKAMITYDETIDGWYIAGEVWPRTNISWESPNLLKLQNMIETFPDCLRNDLNVVALLYLIVIFNPDAPKLRFRNGVRQEQYIYIYLLKRYLVSLFGSTCEASDYHYRLMAKIEAANKLPDTLIFEQIQLGSTNVLRNRVVKLVQHKSITMGNTND